MIGSVAQIEINYLISLCPRALLTNFENKLRYIDFKENDMSMCARRGLLIDHTFQVYDYIWFIYIYICIYI